jgi:NAD(P)-dependent dehydrogenase (short-subunit alcohol dehydrogenase family)
MSGYLDRLANIKGKVAVLVGGGDGVGRGVSLALAEAGCHLAICDIEDTGTAETVAMAQAHGVKVMSSIIDATETDQLSGFFDQVEREFPDGIDILVNLVGGVKRMHFADSTPADWARDIHRNWVYALESSHRAIRLMRRKGNGGSIINFTTIEAHRGAGSFAVYAGAKAALTNWSRALAVELGSENIRVNCLAPDVSPSKTSGDSLEPELLAASAKLKPGQWERMWPIYVPMGYCPPVEELAKGVLYLASDLSATVTGTTLHVDGGTYAASGFLNWPYNVGYLPCPQGDALGTLYPAQPGDETPKRPGSSFLAGKVE